MSTAERSREASHGVSDEMRRTLIAAVHESVCGTFETCRRDQKTSAYRGRPEVIDAPSERCD
jgi:hypothetical protein